jgi:5-methylcytosine-specific restriction endonuclease McrA
VRELGLSESVSLNFIAVARKSREIPAIQEQIANGFISVSKVRKVLPVLTQENQDHWLKLVAEAPTRIVEKEVARIQPQAAAPEKVSYVTDKRVQLQVGMSEEQILRLRRIQDLESQRQKRAVSLEETLDVLMQEYLGRRDPVKKASRAVARKGLPARMSRDIQTRASTQSNQKQPLKREPISAVLKHAVMHKYQGRCGHMHPKTGERCRQRRWLEVHHIQPVSHGGRNELTNLILLCSSHHRAEHG